MNQNHSWQVPTYKVIMWEGRTTRNCIVIPVINEGDRIKSLLNKMSKLKIVESADIVIVDGGTTDDSLEINSLVRFGVRGLLLKTGPGKLSAQLRCVYAFALEHGYEGVVTIDGNDKDEPDAIPQFIKALDEGIDFCSSFKIH